MGMLHPMGSGMEAKWNLHGVRPFPAQDPSKIKKKRKRKLPLTVLETS
jgi:hypothetical protein